MHQLLHLEIIDHVPLLFSERCDGSLRTLVSQYRDEKIRELRPWNALYPQNDYVPSKLWLIIAEQLVHGMNYMIERAFFNMDLKPSNVLHVLRGGRILCMLSDYGMCGSKSEKESDGSFTGHFRGTPYYNPRPSLAKRMTCESLSIFNWACILLCIIDIGLKDGPAFLEFLNTDPDDRVQKLLWDPPQGVFRENVTCLHRVATPNHLPLHSPSRVFLSLSYIVEYKEHGKEYDEYCANVVQAYKDFCSELNDAPRDVPFA